MEANQPDTVLIASVGVTPDPIVEAMVKAREEGPLTLVLVYGRALAGQEPTPFSIANIICQKAKELGVPVRVFELDDPENLDESFQLFQQVMKEVSELGVSRILLDFTGGTKVMAASMVHVALSQQWGTDIIFEYVGGPRDEYGRAKEMVVQRAPQTIVQELASKVVECLRQQDYARAMYISEGLPKRGKAGFLKKVTLLLWHWDNFHYEAAFPLIEECAGQAKVLIDNAQYSTLADTVTKLQRVADRIRLALEALEELQKGGQPSLAKGSAEGWLYILGDTVANARRRVNSNPTDSVLRSYRAIEVATQIGLASLGINPWHPAWDALPEAKRSNYLRTFGVEEPPHQLSLWNGFNLLESLTSQFAPQIKADIIDITSSRNYSYLEHGYNKVSKDTAKKILAKMEGVVTTITSKAGIRRNPLDCAEELRLEA